jgi:ribosomal-protein-alanine N-acetyltransferase
VYISVLEIASLKKLIYRPATRGDAPRIAALFRQAKLEHKHADWSYPSDWLDRPGFFLCELEEDGMLGEVIACLGAAADPPPAAWVRLAAASDQVKSELVFVELMNRIRPQLAEKGINELGWLVADGWPDEWLEAIGFERTNTIVTYVKFGVEKPEAETHAGEIRRATLDDFGELASVEEAAFEPLWRHSEESLRTAFGHSICFDVADLNGRIVGFHYSARGLEEDTAHLVRITIHPEAQCRNIGSGLMAAAMESYIRLGIRRITLNTQEDNLASHKLYEKFGFRRLGDRIPLWVKNIG